MAQGPARVSWSLAARGSEGAFKLHKTVLHLQTCRDTPVSNITYLFSDGCASNRQARPAVLHRGDSWPAPPPSRTRLHVPPRRQRAEPANSQASRLLRGRRHRTPRVTYDARSQHPSRAMCAPRHRIARSDGPGRHGAVPARHASGLCPGGQSGALPVARAAPRRSISEEGPIR